MPDYKLLSVSAAEVIKVVKIKIEGKYSQKLGNYISKTSYLIIIPTFCTSRAYFNWVNAVLKTSNGLTVLFELSPMWFPRGKTPRRWAATFAAAAAASLQSCLTRATPEMAPTRFPRPWDSPGKNTGVGCHFLLQATFARFSQTWGRWSHRETSPDISTRGHSISTVEEGRTTTTGLHSAKRHWPHHYWFLRTKYNAIHVKSCLIFLRKRQILKPKLKKT